MVHVGLIFTIDLISLKFSVESTDTRIGNQSFNNHFLKYDVSKIPTSKGTSGFTLFQILSTNQVNIGFFY